MLIAAAGPATSISLAAAFGLSALALLAFGAPGLLGSALAWLALINGILALFNLIPAAPLDGGRILSALLWFRHGNRYRAAATAAQVGVGFGWLLVAIGAVGFIAGIGFGSIWTALIGWFLVSAARAEGEMARSRLAFGDLRVRDVMISNPPRVRGWITVSDFLEEDAPHLHDPVAVVERFDGTIAGLVSVDRLRSAPAAPEEGARRVQDYMVPVSTIRVAHPDDRLADIAVRPRAVASGTRSSSTGISSSASSLPKPSHRARRSLPYPLERALGLALGVTLRDRPPLVVRALAFRHGQLDLGSTILEVHPQRHERDAFLAGGAGQRVDLLAVQQQLAATRRVELGA